VFSEAYGPYGDIQKTWTNTYDPKMKFSGKEREGYSDLDYFGARYFDHRNYRFNSVDPIINKAAALSNPQVWNLYSFCRNNPITYMDPDGRLILKLKSWEVVNKRHPSGGSARGRKGYLLTDDRKSKIVATKYSKKNWKTNCIGYAFAEGKYWINPQENGKDQIQKIR
jgi:RHS repeat-associated protein